MQAHRIHVVVPENHRMTIELPETVPSGPAELIVLVPQRDERKEQIDAPLLGRGRLAALACELARSSKPFRELTLEERRARLRRLRGSGRGLTSGSEGLARYKSEDVEIEERKLGR